MPHFDHPTDAAMWLRQRLGAGMAAGAGCTLVADHRRLQPGDGFLAWAGDRHDARQFVPAALEAGAPACLVQAEGWDGLAAGLGLAADDVRIGSLAGLRARAGEVADRYFAQPSRTLQVLAVTGTNGKTSTAWWLAQALAALGRRCAAMGTLGVGEPAADPEAAAFTGTGLTTPDALSLHAALRRLADEGVAACALEASSIGIVQGRLAGLHIGVALFTNLTPDHLDLHGSPEAYWQAKKALFDWPELGAAVVNVDDAHGAALAAELAGRQGRGPAPALWTVALDAPARLCGQELQQRPDGLSLRVQEFSPEGQPLQAVALRTGLVGRHNAANLLGVLGGLRALGLPLDLAAGAVAALTPVPGRLQRVGAPSDEVEVLVDYAHTPDALDQVLQSLRPLAASRGGRLWCVFGCGGNRDASKRPAMGAIAARRADAVVLTSDNPRDEPPARILAQILAGVTGHDEVQVLEDRREAIAHAIAAAAPGDVVLIAGKGHETSQEMAGVRRPFSDAREARAALALRRGAGALHAGGGG
jgi:murE/murF fusion protein